MLFQMDRAASILVYCSQAPLSVSELSRKVKGNHEKTIRLIRDLKERHLLQSSIAKKRARGRPNQMLRTTVLGEQYVREYRQLADLRLFSNDNDIKKALHQTDLAAKLDEQKISPYVRFQEINELARNIRRTAKT